MEAEETQRVSFLNADRLNDADKLHIAQVIGYSETAFVSSDEEVDFEVSFFTTTGEVDFCATRRWRHFLYYIRKVLSLTVNIVREPKQGYYLYRSTIWVRSPWSRLYQRLGVPFQIPKWPV